MKEKISAIVLSSIKHSDRHNVTSVYTREKGRMALLTPAGTSRKGRQSTPRMLPLGVFEAQISTSATRELNLPSSVTPIRIWRSIYYDPLKSSVAFFLSEFLNKLLRDSPPEPHIWDFIVNSTDLFDSDSNAPSIANFHIAFLIGMAHLMGIYPDISDYTEGMEFDMKAGGMVLPFYSLSPKGTRIDAQRSSILPKILRMNFMNSRVFKFSGKERSELLDYILKYFGCHFPGCDNLKSLEVLKEIFY